MKYRYKAVVVGIDHWNDLTGPLVKELQKHNKDLSLVIIDNASLLPYPSTPWRHVLRLKERVGYAEALNIGMAGEPRVAGQWEWAVVMNNDCWCHGNITNLLPTLRTDTIYGPDWDTSYKDMIQSGFLFIPRPVFDVVGTFDQDLEAAFEDFDYFIRALAHGFRLDVIPEKVANLKHLFVHTRYETQGYNSRWEASAHRFFEKHPAVLKMKENAHAYQKESENVQR